MGEIKRSLGVLATGVLAAVGLGGGPASAAAQPVPRAKAAWQQAMAHVRAPGRGCYRASYPALTWHATTCVAAPKMAAVPRPAGPSGRGSVGDNGDYAAKVPGLILGATGTFRNVSPGITEQGQLDNSGPQIPNAFMLQINSDYFSGTPACSGSKDPSQCQGWQQFMYSYDAGGSAHVYMQYWLVNYNAPCPSGWWSNPGGCYVNSASVKVSPLTAGQLGDVKLSGTTAGGLDGVSMSVGSGQAVLVSASDSKLDLAPHWNEAEWNVVGDGGGGMANFGPNASMDPHLALQDTSGPAAPACVFAQGITGETNNLNLTTAPANDDQWPPSIAFSQTSGPAGPPGCSVAG